MARRGFFGSLFTATGIAVVLFLVLYFFVPSFSEKYFGISWSMKRTGLSLVENSQVKELSSNLISWMEDAGLSQKEIQNMQKKLQDKWKSAEFRKQVSQAVSAGKDAVTDLLEDMK